MFQFCLSLKIFAAYWCIYSFPFSASSNVATNDLLCFNSVYRCCCLLFVVCFPPRSYSLYEVSKQILFCYLHGFVCQISTGLGLFFGGFDSVVLTILWKSVIHCCHRISLETLSDIRDWSLLFSTFRIFVHFWLPSPCRSMWCVFEYMYRVYSGRSWIFYQVVIINTSI